VDAANLTGGRHHYPQTTNTRRAARRAIDREPHTIAAPRADAYRATQDGLQQTLTAATATNLQRVGVRAGVGREFLLGVFEALKRRSRSRASSGN
jgi:hypothetical protein